MKDSHTKKDHYGEGKKGADPEGVAGCFCCTQKHKLKGNNSRRRPEKEGIFLIDGRLKFWDTIYFSLKVRRRERGGTTRNPVKSF